MIYKREKRYMWLVIFVCSNMLGLYQILSQYTQIYFTDMICILLGILTLLYEGVYKFKDYRFLGKRVNIRTFTWFLLLWTIVEIFYTTLRYGNSQSFIVTVQASLFCLIPAIVSFAFINIEKKDAAADFMVEWIIKIGTVCSIVAIIAYFLLVTSGSNFFNLDVENYSFIRNGRPHYMVGAMIVVPATVFLWNKLITKEINTSVVLGFIINCIHVFYIGQTRTLMAYVLITFGVSFIGAKKRNKAVRFFIIFGSIILYILSEFNSFSTITGELITNNSVVYRLEAISFYTQQIAKNPILGMGFVGNTNTQLNTLLYGAYNRYYRTDVGLIGFVNGVGILGLIWFIAFVIYGFMRINRTKNHYQNDYIWLCTFSFLIFATISSINLFIIDSYRLFYFPILALLIGKYESMRDN